MAESSPLQPDEFDKETLSRLENLFIKFVTPDNVVHVFHKYDINVLTRQDMQKVKAKAENKGDMEGASLLFSRLQHYRGWYECLLKVLRDCEVKLAHVAESMEEKVTSHRPAKIRRIDTLVMVGETPKDQGYQGTDRNGGQTSDLHLRLLHCEKNPGHTVFIPVVEFKMDHLPSQYQDSDIVDWIRSWADRTVRVKGGIISGNRPEYFSDDETIPFPLYNYKGKKIATLGTGYVGSVTKYADKDGKNCECNECIETGAELSTKVWGEVYIITASHVVYDEIESKHVTCYFNFDSSETDQNDLLTLHGLKVWHCSTKEDRCILKYITHDVNLVNKLDKMLDRCEELKTKVFHKYKGEKSDDPSSTADSALEHKLCVCISHPHGCSKQITIGTWTERKVIEKGKFKLKDDRWYDGELTQYVYNTSTCPGSAGAPVISPICREVYGELWHGLCHPHAQSHPGNTNISALNWEHVLPSTS